MTLIIDSNERNVLLRAAACADLGGDNVRVCALECGDFEAVDRAGNSVALFERKTLPDLVASICDGRWETQLRKLQLHREERPDCVVGVVIEYDVGLDRALVDARVRDLSRDAVLTHVNAAAAVDVGLRVLWTSDARQTVHEMCKYAKERRRVDDDAPPAAPLEQRVLNTRKRRRQTRHDAAPDTIWAHMIAGVMHDNAAYAIAQRYPDMDALTEACRRDGVRAVQGIAYQRGGTTAHIGKTVAKRLVAVVSRKRRKS